MASEENKQSENLVCNKENYVINFQKEKVQEIKKQLQEQALKEGFKLIMDTGYKGKCF